MWRLNKNKYATTHFCSLKIGDFFKSGENTYSQTSYIPYALKDVKIKIYIVNFSWGRVIFGSCLCILKYVRYMYTMVYDVIYYNLHTYIIKQTGWCHLGAESVSKSHLNFYYVVYDVTNYNLFYSSNYVFWVKLEYVCKYVLMYVFSKKQGDNFFKSEWEFFPINLITFGP